MYKLYDTYKQYKCTHQRTTENGGVDSCTCLLLSYGSTFVQWRASDKDIVCIQVAGTSTFPLLYNLDSTPSTGVLSTCSRITPDFCWWEVWVILSSDRLLSLIFAPSGRYYRSATTFASTYGLTMVKEILNPDEERAPLNPNNGDTDNLIRPVEMDLGMILEKGPCCVDVELIDSIIYKVESKGINMAMLPVRFHPR